MSRVQPACRVVGRPRVEALGALVLAAGLGPPLSLVEQASVAVMARNRETIKSSCETWLARACVDSAETKRRSDPNGGERSVSYFGAYSLVRLRFVYPVCEGAWLSVSPRTSCVAAVQPKSRCSGVRIRRTSGQRRSVCGSRIFYRVGEE